MSDLFSAFGGSLPIGLAGLAAFVSVLALWQALRIRDPMARRARSIAEREDELRTNLLSARKRRSEWTSATPQDFMARVVARLKLMQGQKTQELRDHLARGGLRAREALITYLFFKLVLPLAFGAAAVIALEVLNLYPMPPLGRVTVALLMVLFGAYAPEIWLKNRISKRQKQLEKGLPDALDLLVICVEAGLSLDAALKRTAGELERGAPELADEFGLTSVELGFLPDRATALRNLAARTGIKSLSGVISALLQTEKFGTPLAQSLRVLASEFRTQRLLRAEEKAARLPATLTVPMVVFILPTLFIVLVGPAIINVLDNLRGL